MELWKLIILKMISSFPRNMIFNVLLFSAGEIWMALVKCQLLRPKSNTFRGAFSCYISTGAIVFLSGIIFTSAKKMTYVIMLRCSSRTWKTWSLLWWKKFSHILLWFFFRTPFTYYKSKMIPKRKWDTYPSNSKAFGLPFTANFLILIENWKSVPYHLISRGNHNWTFNNNTALNTVLWILSLFFLVFSEVKDFWRSHVQYFVSM